MFNDIIEFHKKNGLPSPGKPALLTTELLDFRVKFMQEELDEYQTACDAKDLVAAADALTDLMYVALGTAYLMGLPMPEIWKVVHEANMTKVRAVDIRDSKRGSTFDVVKPLNFISPELNIQLLLEACGWKA